MRLHALVQIGDGTKLNDLIWQRKEQGENYCTHVMII